MSGPHLLLPFPCGTPGGAGWEWREGARPPWLPQKPPGRPRAGSGWPGCSRPTGRGCARTQLSPLPTLTPEAFLLVDWTDSLPPVGWCHSGGGARGELGKRSVLGGSDLEFRRAVERRPGDGLAPTLSPGALIFREGRGSLLKWDHVTTVIEGFVSLCCLGNRNINQDAVCRGLELGASGERGGPWAGRSGGGAEGWAGPGGGPGGGTGGGTGGQAVPRPGLRLLALPAGLPGPGSRQRL